MLDYIRSNKISLLLLLPVVAVLLWEQSFRGIELIIFPFDKNPMPFYKLTILLIPPIPFLYSIVGLVLVLFNSFLITHLNKQYMIIEARTYLPALIYIIFSGIFIPLQAYSPGVPASTFVILAIDKLFKTYNDKKRISDFFDASLFLAIASLFYFNVIYLIIFIWIRISSEAGNRLKVAMVTIVGLILPYFFTWSYFYLSDCTDTFISSITANFASNRFIPDINLSYIVFFTFSAILIFLSSIKLIRRFRGIKINIRKYFISLFYSFILLGFTTILTQSTFVELLPVFAISVSFLVSYYIYNTKSRFFGNLILISFMVIIIFIHVFKYLHFDILN